MLAAALALLLAGCSICDEDNPWRTTYITAAEAAALAEPAQSGVTDCGVATELALARMRAKASGAVVDPDLVEIARLEIERDCYRNAERRLRERLTGKRDGATGLK